MGNYPGYAQARIQRFFVHIEFIAIQNENHRGDGLQQLSKRFIGRIDGFDLERVVCRIHEAAVKDERECSAEICELLLVEFIFFHHLSWS